MECLGVREPDTGQDASSSSFCPHMCRMDPNSSQRLVVRVGAYVKLSDDDGQEYCKPFNNQKILNMDSTNWNDLLLEISKKLSQAQTIEHVACESLPPKIVDMFIYPFKPKQNAGI